MSIINFDEYTYELNEMELKCAHIIAERISPRVGILRAVKNTAISKYFIDNHKIKIGPARIRKIINYIRTNGLVPNLIAGAKGYYVSTDAEEIRKYVYSLRQRSNAIARIADAMEVQSLQKHRL